MEHRRLLIVTAVVAGTVMIVGALPYAAVAAPVETLAATQQYQRDDLGVEQASGTGPPR